jgi:hypothetical protein
MAATKKTQVAGAALQVILVLDGQCQDASPHPKQG